MKRNFITLLLAIAICFSLKAQFITINGKQFKNNDGSDFYPIMCDYLITPAYNDITSGFYLAATPHYGADLTYECNSYATCTTNIYNDFQEIASMGFNTVRLTAFPNWHSDATSYGFSLWAIHNYGGPWETYEFPFSDANGYATDPNVKKYFTQLGELVGLAGACGLKVLLDVFGVLKTNTGPNTNFSPTMNSKAIAYLAAFGDHFKIYPNILGNTLMEEIYINDPFSPIHTKNEVCSIISSYYDALKAADPNHLISVSGFDVEDLYVWDLSIMKVDFYQPHIYPEIMSYEIQGSDNTFAVAQQLKRYAGRAFWLANNCPIPWLIGETGFRADDGYSPTYPTYYNGSETQQANYAQFTLDRTRDCGGSGYGWWQYQSQYELSLAQPDGFGLIRNGVLVTVPLNPFYEKPLVTNFRNYQTPAPVPSLCTMPDNYYDPFDFALYNTAETNAITGFVIDQDGNPIKDAVVMGWNYLSGSGSGTVGKVTYTFTDANGFYKIVPYNWVTGIHQIYHIRVSATGSECEDVGTFDGTIPLPSNWPISFQLQSLTPNYLTTVSNLINTGNDTYLGNENLWVFDTDIMPSSSATFIARDYVHITPLFHAAPYSTTHIYTSAAPPCSYTTGFRLMPEQQQETQVPPLGKFEIKPNPNTGTFKVSFSTTDALQATIKIYDIVGKVVMEKTYAEIIKEVEIDASALSKGVYILEATLQNGEQLKQKIVIE